MKVSRIKELFVIIFLPLCLGMYKIGWMQGYYQDGALCKPWHSSCKTWSDNTQWDSCENYMFLNSTSNMWEHCKDGDYYDSIKEVWRSWDGSCNSYCNYQSHWLSWSSTESLNIELMKWDSTCPDSFIMINSTQMNIPSIWRSYEYYVVPHSNQTLELGTRNYPYRTMKAVASEILNIHSHSNANIIIYVTDAYLEDANLIFINITSVTITTHPDFLALKDYTQDGGKRTFILNLYIYVCLISIFDILDLVA